MPNKRKKKLSPQARRRNALFLIIILIAIICFAVFGEKEEEIILPDFLIDNTTPTTVHEITAGSNSSNSISNGVSSLEIYFFDVGQADCILINQGDESMLIDAGNNADGKLIVEYLKHTLKLSNLKYVVGTHSHEDHIGGLDDIIKNIPTENILMPFVSDVDTKTYEDVENAVLEKNLEITNPKIGDTFNIGEAYAEVMFVDNNEPEEKNDQSIVLQLTFGNKKYLFMGDAETKTEKARNWNEVDVLKVGHHGSSSSSSDKFLKQINPDIAIISVGPNNTYNLPKSNIIKRIQKYTSELYRTDEVGTILITSDGETNLVSKLNVCLDGNSR